MANETNNKKLNQKYVDSLKKRGKEFEIIRQMEYEFAINYDPLNGKKKDESHFFVQNFLTCMELFKQTEKLIYDGYYD